MSAGCTEKENENEPAEIPFTEYSLAETNCQWQWTNFVFDNKVIVINSKTELERYITCTEGTFPEIDFSKHTLLFAGGGTLNGVVKVESTIIKNSENEYTLKITVCLDFTTVVQGWKTFILTSKISDKSNVKSDVTQTHNF
jgi:hypothetical protein